uniref:Eph receptor B6 n=1 Tax=Hucho hucho TaxID=62062 RepID=A0A4W5KGV3_9TELE
MGGRSEVWYGVVCRICPSATFTAPGACSWCGEAVTFTPSQTGIKQTKVTLNNLLTRVTYLIQVQAVNDVSALSPFPPQFTSINFTTSQSVPSPVPSLHQLSRAPDSITLSWPQPDRPNGDILEYQLRYYDKGSDEDSAVSVFSETNTVTVNSLAPGSIYAFQIRARNERGYGPYSHTIYFTTLALEESSKQIQNRLPLLVGSVMGGAAFLLVIVAIVVVFVFRSKRRESPYSDRLQRYISHKGGVKYYVDPSTYEDPSEAVKEFAREIDPSHLKIEEVIGAGRGPGLIHAYRDSSVKKKGSLSGVFIAHKLGQESSWVQTQLIISLSLSLSPTLSPTPSSPVWGGVSGALPAPGS